MRRGVAVLLALGLSAAASGAWAQNTGVEEVVVTGFKRLNPDEEDENGAQKPPPVPASVQMLRRHADFAVQQVIVISDTSDVDQRHSEIYAMTRNALGQASKSGVLLATGELVVEPLTLSNYNDLKIEEDDETSGEVVKFIVKTPLSQGADPKATLAKIEAFLKAVPVVGRAEIKPYSELTLSVVNPEQYRSAIIDLVAKDTAMTTERFGEGYGVEVTGLDRPVQWKRASYTEVQLYLPSTSTVRPRN